MFDLETKNLELFYILKVKGPALSEEGAKQTARHRKRGWRYECGVPTSKGAKCPRRRVRCYWVMV
jgi:hypothetical protein